MPFRKYPNLTEDGFNPFENLSEKLNRNRDEFFDGFLMGDLVFGEKQISLWGQKNQERADTRPGRRKQKQISVSFQIQIFMGSK